MNRKFQVFLSATILLGALLARGDGPGSKAKPAYPPARTVDAADTYHGVTVLDPYRWMENLESEETKAWARAQDQFGSSLLMALPEYSHFKSRILALTAYEGVSPARVAGGQRFYTHLPAGARSRALVEVAESDAAPGRILVDSNQFPAEQTLSMVLPSNDGKLLAYGISRNSSSWYELHFLDVATGKELPDVLPGMHAAANIWWGRDSRGIYYGSFPPPAPGKELTHKRENQKVSYHHLGALPKADEVLFSRPQNPDWRFAVRETEDGQYVVIAATVGTSSKSGLYVRETGNAGPWKEIIPVGEESFTFLGNSGSTFWLQTNADAPRGRVIAVDIADPARAHWQSMIPEAKDTLSFVNLVDHRFIAVYVQDARHTIKVFSGEGTFEREVKFPDLGTTFSGFVGKSTDRYAYYSFNSASYPGGASVFRLDARTGQSVPFRQPKLPYRPADYETRQVFYTSKDGTRVPMYLAAKKGVKLQGGNPLLLYAYGAAGWQAIPWYQPQVLAWMEAGGVYAVANARGGGEYGEQWHQAGIKQKKQNTIDDFISAAEWLIAQGYTTRAQLALNGGSLSSPLAGAALTQRPDLAGAVLMDISVTDMVRYDHFTGGAGWRADLGSSADPGEFRALLAYSPYHNLKPGTCYPHTLITAGERDETTVPSHSYKFTAALQAAQGCDHPTVMQIMWGTGHILGRTREQSAEILGRQLAFLADTLKMEVKR